MDTNTVVEPLDDSHQPLSGDDPLADAPIVILEAVGAEEPMDDNGSDGSNDAADSVGSADSVGAVEAADPREALLARSSLWDSAVATRDEALARRLLHPAFALEIVQPIRSVMGRDLWLEVLADYVVHEWETEDQLVDLDGDYAAVLQRVRMRATVIGEDRSGIFVVTDLWRRVDGEWFVWRRHSTPLIAGRLPGVTES